MDDQAHADAINRVKKASDHYSVLGVPRGAAAEEVKRAYRKLVIRLHPDHNGQPGAEEAFKTLVEAYVVLSDARQRELYDSGSSADNEYGKRKRKTHKAKQRPATAEEIAAQAELDQMLKRELQRAQHADWLQRARREQSELSALALVVFGVCTLGVVIGVMYVAQPEPASGPQALRLGWGAWLSSQISWHASFAGRFVMGVTASALIILAAPFAITFFVYGVGKVCEWSFDALALVGRLLHPLMRAIEVYVNGIAARRGAERRAGRRR